MDATRDKVIIELPRSVRGSKSPEPLYAVDKVTKAFSDAARLLGEITPLVENISLVARGHRDAANGLNDVHNRILTPFLNTLNTARAGIQAAQDADSVKGVLDGVVSEDNGIKKTKEALLECITALQETTGPVSVPEVVEVGVGVLAAVSRRS